MSREISLRQLAVLAATILMTIAGPARALGPDTPQHMGMHGGMHGMMMRAGSKAPGAAPAAMARFGCTSCHALHGAGVGPAFAWIAWRYREQPDAKAAVAAFIEHGGQGAWGGVMPNLGVPADDASDIAQWILSLPPEQPPTPPSGSPR